MRSLYALHPQTVLELHDRGAVIYGQPVALSVDEVETRILQEEFSRVVVDQELFHSADAMRALRRIARVRPDVAVAWLRSGVATAGTLTLEGLLKELSGERTGLAGAQVVIVSPDDPIQSTGVAYALACHISRHRPVRLVESDTTAPVLSRDFQLPPQLAQFLVDGVDGIPLRGWPHDLRLVPAPREPGLLLRLGMEPLSRRLAALRVGADVIVRADANLSDRGLLGALAQASDVVVCGPLSEDYADWLGKLAPRAAVRHVVAGRTPKSPLRAARAGERVWKEMHSDDGA